jgi:O-antigen/teichoic acid export membrane protein
MFREGKVHVDQNARTARKLLSSGIVTGLAAAVLCYLCAPVMPILAGKSFTGSISAIRWLCLLPVIAAAFNFAINLYLIPRYSWLGAAWASLMTDALMGIGNWVMYLLVCRRATPAGPSGAA